MGRHRISENTVEKVENWMEENPQEGITEVNKAIEYLVDKGIKYENKEGLKEEIKEELKEELL